jgi:NhaP-type Na+/H+ or K+/H+ antiporter
MTFSLSLMLILGLIANRLFEMLRLPGLLGMLLLGVLLGPHGLDFMSPEMLAISADLRLIALIIILLRAGLGLKRETLNKVGRPALRMSFIPGLLEGGALILLGMFLFDLSFYEAGMLGFIIAAVSPAVVVPQMLGLIESRRGESKGVPTMVLAGASVDDVVAITFFTLFTGLYMGTRVSPLVQILEIPLAIGLGMLIGAGTGAFLIFLFKRHHIRDTKKVLILLGVAILLKELENVLAGVLPIASLLGVMTIGFVLLEYSPKVAGRLSHKFNKIWVLAEILLFILVGSQVDVSVAWHAGGTGLLLIAGGLVARSIGVWISLVGTSFNRGEKAFAVLAYVPKATVQAAIGAIPLSLGVHSGELILAIAVLSILITAPLGAIGIRWAGERFLAIG